MSVEGAPVWELPRSRYMVFPWAGVRTVPLPPAPQGGAYPLGTPLGERVEAEHVTRWLMAQDPEGDEIFDPEAVAAIAAWDLPAFTGLEIAVTICAQVPQALAEKVEALCGYAGAVPADMFVGQLAKYGTHTGTMAAPPWGGVPMAIDVLTDVVELDGDPIDLRNSADFERWYLAYRYERIESLPITIRVTRATYTNVAKLNLGAGFML
jgi:hypothetical protein